MNSTRKAPTVSGEFSVFKIAAVVSGLGLVAMTGLVLWYVTSGGAVDHSKAAEARLTISQIAGNLAHYRAACRTLPTTEQGLDALVKAPSRAPLCEHFPDFSPDKIPLDPWGHPFVYESDGNTFILKSLGADGKEGGENNDADIVYHGSP